MICKNIETYQVKSPIVFIVFNRPEVTQQVFNIIRKSQPKKLYLISDGPRKDKPNDESLCQKVRDIVCNIDWECDVKKNFSEENLGCGVRVSSGISWVFENEDKAIIIEDDVLPSLKFFQFCDEMLDRYENNKTIAQISGANLQNITYTPDSYFISKYSAIWGWATWKRAWKGYSQKLENWECERKNNHIADIFNKSEWLELRYKIDLIKAGDLNTWDYQWDYHRLKQNGYNIFPKKNLIKNLGLGSGTHTNKMNNQLNDLAIDDLDFPLDHPADLTPCNIFDKQYYERMVKTPFLNKLKFRTKTFLKKLLGSP